MGVYAQNMAWERPDAQREAPTQPSPGVPGEGKIAFLDLLADLKLALHSTTITWLFPSTIRSNTSGMSLAPTRMQPSESCCPMLF